MWPSGGKAQQGFHLLRKPRCSYFCRAFPQPIGCVIPWILHDSTSTIEQQDEASRVKWRLFIDRKQELKPTSMETNENPADSRPVIHSRKIQPLAYFIFATRWLQFRYIWD